MAASRGVFNLFNPGGKGKEGLKHFIYEGAFEHNGKPYYLAGHKDVRDGGDSGRTRRRSTRACTKAAMREARSSARGS